MDANHRVPVDALDLELLQWLQDGFPLEERPWDAGEGILHVPGDELLARTRRLYADGVIRSFHAIVNGRGPGSRQSTLMALKVPEEDIGRVVAIVNEYPVITHNYRRNHEYNIWFTVTERGGQPLQETLDAIRERTGIPESSILDLRTTRLFKVDVRFRFTIGPLRPRTLPVSSGEYPPMDAVDHDLLQAAQEGIPLMREPFGAMAGSLGIPTRELLDRLRRLQAAGVVRRVGISVNQRRLGIVANAMVAWKVPSRAVGAVGTALSSFAEVTHCYERSIVPGRWEYNLFTVLHGYDEASVKALAEILAGTVGIHDYLVLFSTDQYKRTSLIHEFPAPRPPADTRPAAGTRGNP